MEMVAQHWKKIGIRLDVKDTERNLSLKQVAANEQQFYVWGGGNADIFMWPRHDMPAEPNEPFSGTLYATWYASNGASGKKPEDPELLKALELFRGAFGKEEADRIKSAQEIWKLIVEETWTIGTVGLSPAVMGVRIVKNNLGNIPQRQFNGQHGRTPCAAMPVTWFFKS